MHYGKPVEAHLKDTTIVVQEKGIHDDPLFDILVGEKRLGSGVVDFQNIGLVGRRVFQVGDAQFGMHRTTVRKPV